MSEPSTPEVERWRSKYYDSLDELERKEAQWRQVEELLRQGIMRISAAVPPGDLELDKCLEKLRAGLRDSTPMALAGLLEEIGREADRIELARSSEISPAVSLAAQTLNAITVRTLQPRVAQEARLLAENLANVRTPEEVRRLGERLALSLDDLLGGGNSLEQALLRLLEYLAFPAEFAPRVEAIKTELCSPLTPERIEALLRSIAGLVSEMRSRVIHEKRELEDFLKQLTENLKELDQNLHTAVVAQLESFSEGHKLGVAVSAHMEDLEASVQSANALADLKTIISQRVMTIRSHMEAFRKAEEARTDDARRDIAALTHRLAELEAEAERLRERIRYEHKQALLDPLTGIHNRLAYDERVEQEFLRWQRYQSPLVVIVVDVDRFKRINDTYGHQAGDKVLRVVAKLVKSKLRSTDFVARYGGEEFVALLPETTLEQAHNCADKLRLAVQEAEFQYRGERVKITVSCGLSAFCEGDGPDDAFARADQALYDAKEEGRNRCKSA